MTMIPIDIPPDLITKTAPELLKFLASSAAAGVSKDVIVWVREKIKSEVNQRKYGFTPDPETAASLQNITNSDAYKRMKECIGPHSRYLNMVRMGLRIEKLSNDGDREKIDELKNNIYSKYGREGITILNMGSVGALVALINHLSQLKIDNDYSQDFLLEYFEEIIKDWNRITIFHQSEHGQDDLMKKINTYLERRTEVFFVFGIGTAGDQATRVIATLSTSETLRNKGYMAKLILKKADKSGLLHFAWIFELVNVHSFDKVVLHN